MGTRPLPVVAAPARTQTRRFTLNIIALCRILYYLPQDIASIIIAARLHAALLRRAAWRAALLRSAACAPHSCGGHLDGPHACGPPGRTPAEGRLAGRTLAGRTPAESRFARRTPAEGTLTGRTFARRTPAEGTFARRAPAPSHHTNGCVRAPVSPRRRSRKKAGRSFMSGRPLHSLTWLSLHSSRSTMRSCTVCRKRSYTCRCAHSRSCPL